MFAKKPLCSRALLGLLLLTTLCIPSGYGQSPPDAAVDVTASAGTSVPWLTLRWSHRMTASITNYGVYRRIKGANTWNLLSNLPATTTSYPDSTAEPGTNYEYRVMRECNTAPTRAYGYLNAAAGAPMVEDRGDFLLLVDATLSNALGPEITQLQQDLTGDGWKVLRYDLPRTAVEPSNTNSTVWASRSNELWSVKNVIVTNYNAAPTRVKAVYLLGRLPVPYSGTMAPDGHGNHVGAWPADVYYGDIDGNWTDSSANNTSASDTRNWNVRGDGKFDQSSIPSNIELQVGRIHFNNMTGFPNSNMTETELTRRYLRRAHDYRHRQGAYANVPRRGMVDDNFGWFGGEAFGVVGWATGYSWFGGANVSSRDWFNTLRTDQYLFAYGCGGGSSTGAGGVGSSTDFAKIPSRAVFQVLFGSYLGDWEYGNNFMRASLAGNPESEGLTCCWGDRPYWFFHHMALGETIGYSTRLSQNNGYSDLAYNGNGFVRYAHVGLLGDPALRLHMVFPPANLRALAANGEVRLEWETSADTNLLGYHVYRSGAGLSPYQRLTSTVLASNIFAFSDTAVTNGQSYTYMVRALKFETGTAGSYENLSQGSFVRVVIPEGGTGAPANPNNLKIVGSNAAPVRLSWHDNSSDETGFELQRRAGPTNVYVTLASLPADATDYADPGPLPGGVTFYYRVRAINQNGVSPWSEEASVYAFPGYVQFNGKYFIADRVSGVATAMLSRIFGGMGATRVTVTPGNISATNGIHFAPTNSGVVWADGQSGDAPALIPLPNDGLPKLARSFNLTISAPTNGAFLGFTNSCEVLIDDSSATLPAPWSGINWTNGTLFLPAHLATENGLFGATMLGGNIGASADAGQFIYQRVGGYGSITARVLPRLASATGAQAGVMMRENLANNARFAFTTLNIGTGAKLQTRVSTGSAAAVTPTNNNSYTTPYWVRLTRAGSNFISQVSADGNNWTAITTQAVVMPYEIYWGLAAAGITNDTRFVLSPFQSVSVVTNMPEFQLVMNQSSVLMLTNSIYPFSVTKTDQFGVVWPLTGVVWSATAGMIGTGGFYSAPATPGTYSISAQADGLTANATVTVLPTALVLSPTDNLVSAGAYRGPFSPASKTYTLNNIGNAGVNWSAGGLPPWLELSAQGGRLAGRAGTNIVLSFSPQAMNLAPGEHTAIVGFTNSANGQQMLRQVSLQIQPLGISTALVANAIGQLQPNSCVDVYVTLANGSTSPLTGVSATLKANTPGVFVARDISPYPLLAPGGTATNLMPFKISIPPGFVCGSSNAFTLVVTSAEGTQEFEFTLPSGGASQCSDGGGICPVSFVQFSAANYTAIERATNFDVEVSVTRTGSNTGPVSVNFVTRGGSALNYIPTSGTLVWPDGDMAPKKFSVTVLANSVPALPGTVNLHLSSPTGDVFLGAWTNAILTVQDDDVVLTPVPLIQVGSLWRYADQGEDLGSTWSEMAYDDSTWSSGVAMLGYGDANGIRPRTTNSYGLDPANKYITTYYRKHFVLPVTFGYLGLGGRIQRDDGAVVYLNGIEVFRSNMASNAAISFNDRALAAVGGADETRFYAYAMDPQLLRPGTNVVAVEIHQSDPASTDLAFDFELTATNGPAEVNLPPWLLPVPDQITRIGTPCAPIEITIGDVETPASALRVTVTSSDQLLIANANILVVGNGAKRIMELTPSAGRDGSSVITLTVSDNLTTVSRSFVLTVPPANIAPSVMMTSPAHGATIPPGVVTLTANASDPDGNLQLTEFYLDGTKLGESTNALSMLVLESLPGGYHSLWARATDTEGLMATSAPVFVTVQWSSSNLVGPGAEWQYLDTGLEPGSDWMNPGFDDASWASGPAPLGYGNANGVSPLTTVGFGPNPYNKYITTWFRRAFSTPSVPAWSRAKVSIQRDDGTVVYLNGQEILRNNLPDGVIHPLTFANQAVEGASETNWISLEFEPALLLPGTNWLAVEIHQCTNDSSDIFFDLRLTAQPMNALPSIHAAIRDGSVTLSWPEWAAGMAVYWATNIVSPVEWHRANGNTTGSCELLMPLDAGQRFYRLGSP